MKFLYGLFIVAAGVSALAQQPPAAPAAPVATPDYKAGDVVDGIACAGDPAMTYAYYLPKNYTTDRRWPIVYVFDPRARGAFAAELFRQGAEEFGWVIVSSNNTQSDTDDAPNVRAINAMWPDAQRRFLVDTRRMYTSGFSGGAILAWGVAQTTVGVAGVIGCSGHPFGETTRYDVKFDWFGTAGVSDFNYRPTLEIDRLLAASGASHRVEIFAGGHRWAPPALLRDGMAWLELQAMKRNLRPRDASLITQFFESEMKAAEQGDALTKLRHYETVVRSFEGLHALDGVRGLVEHLRQSPEVKALVQEEAKAAKLEQAYLSRASAPLDRLLRADDAPLAPALAHELSVPRLLQMAKEKTYSGMAAQRVLESIFVQLDFYIAREISGQKLLAAKAVAQMIHPSR